MREGRRGWRDTEFLMDAAMMLVSVPRAPAVASTPDGAGQGGAFRWTGHLRRMDDALAQRALAAAARAWRAAYREAFRSRRWTGMVEVGDAALRIGEAEGAQAVFRTRARKAYLAALLRASQEQALDGVLRAREAFAALGDDEMAGHAARIGAGLAARTGDPGAHTALRATAAAPSGRPPAAGDRRRAS